MTPSSDPGLTGLPQRLAAQLAQLEARGRRVLRPALRRQARDRALAWALPVALVIPALWALSNGALIAMWPHLLIATFVVPLLVGGVLYAVALARQQVSRADALGVIEQQLALKDRLTMSAELLAAPRLDGFGQAALLEAAPWVAQALSQPLAPVRVVRGAAQRRRWLCLPAALLLVVLAWWLQMLAYPSRLAVPSADAPSGSARGAATLSSAAAASAPATRSAGSERPDAADGGHAAARNAGSSGALPSAATAAAGGPGAPAQAQASAQSPAGGARPSPSAAATAAAPAAQQPPGVSRSVTLGTEATPRQGEQRAEAATPGASPDDAGEAGTAAEPRPQGQQSAPSQRGSQPPPADKASPSSRNGQPQNDSRSKGGNDNQNDGKGSGEGQNNGQRKGQEAGAKAGRGFATLMLARPMRDQVLGQTSAGRVSSVLQQGQPQGGPATPAQALDRGRLADGAAVLPARPQTAQDRALLRDYFARDAASPAARPVASAASAGDAPKATP